MSEVAQEKPPARKKTVFFLTWLAALLVTGRFAPFSIVLLPFFPAGLPLAFVGRMEEGDKMIAAALGWALYVVLAFATLTARRRSTFFGLYAVVVVLLLVNMQGCQKAMDSLAHIH
jgi:hypothetical protein